jgi:hypothetical protein
MSEFNSISNEISNFLFSLKMSVERQYRRQTLAKNMKLERFVQSVILIEEARVRFQIYERYRSDVIPDILERIREELLEFLDNFMNSKRVDPELFDLPFRFYPTNRRITNSLLQIRLRSMPRKTEPKIADALIEFRSFVEGINTQLSLDVSNQDLGDLINVIPRQQVAPVQFEIVNNRISILRKSPRTLAEDRKNISAALEQIQGSGKTLIENLEKSNCDRRLLESVIELQSQLINEGNIVKIGLTNLACGVMCDKFSSELPDAIAAMFGSYNSSVSLYVAQFPEWEHFTLKAAQLELNEKDLETVDNATKTLIDQLESNPELVDAEVPKTIEFVRNFLNFPGQSSKRAGFAIIRTIENLISAILRHSVDFIDKTIENTKHELSSAASKAIVGLLTIALVGASGIGPAALQAGAPWVKQVVSLIEKQIENSIK